MPVNVKITEAWKKIGTGLAEAGISIADVEKLKQQLLSLPEPKAIEILEGGRFRGVQAGTPLMEAQRRFARAMNFLQGLKAFQDKLPYKFDAAKREEILKASSQDKVKSELNRIVLEILLRERKSDAGAPPLLELASPRITSSLPLVRHQPVPLSLIYDPLDPKWRFQRAVFKTILVRNMQQQFEDIAVQGVERGKRVMAFVQEHTTEVRHVWKAARDEVNESATVKREWLLFNYTAATGAILNSYEKFSLNVGENQAALKAKALFLGKLFGALKQAPAPLSLLGAMGEYATGQTKVEMLDPRTTFKAKLPQQSAGLIGKISDQLDRLKDLKEDAFRIGPKLGKIDNKSSLEFTLNRLCQVQLETMQTILKTEITERFGDAKNCLSKFNEFRDIALRGKGYDDIKGNFYAEAKGNVFQDGPAKERKQQLEQMMTDHVIGYKNELIAQLGTLLKDTPRAMRLDFFTGAIEMLLYSQYIKELYKTAQTEFFAAPLSPAIVTFFIDNRVLGAADVPHAFSDERHRINWKNGTNHKIALAMFCNWYSARINPFLLLTGGLLDGEPCTPGLIMKLMFEEIDRINEAISAGRTKGLFGKSDWDWTTINLRYKILCSKAQTGLDRKHG